MPENYYCLDNFFHKVTDMESPRKNNDCYFYYYSTCTKGDSCTFRHEPSALGCETTCSFWKEGKCINVRCNFRHMELRKNRKVIPCYWESQPGGCLKPHCPFLHQNPKHPLLSENQGEGSDIKTQDLNKGTAIQSTDSCSKNASQGSEKNFGSPVVDPLVVNFEEESDNESVPTQSPVKLSRIVKVKTLEEIRLERIQAESAAYYSYPGEKKSFPESAMTPSESADDLRKRIMKRLNMKTEDENQQGFQVLSLNEIRNRKKKVQPKSEETEEEEEDEDERPSKRPKTSLPSKAKESDLSQVKIKTLEEIRAERAKKIADSVSSTNDSVQDPGADRVSSDSEVSSTSKCDSDIINLPAVDEGGLKTQCVAKVQPTKRLKRKLSLEKAESSKPKIVRLDTSGGADKDDGAEIVLTDDHQGLDSAKIDSSSANAQKENSPELLNNEKSQNEDETAVIPDITKEGSPTEKLSVDSSKLDEVLLLDEEEFESGDMMKAEEDILKDIDDLLNE